MSRSLFARRAVRVLVVACVVLGSVGARAASAAIQVDDDKAQCPKAGFRRISRALAFAPAGATVQVCPGTYPEALQIATPGVRVVGLTGNPADVVIRRAATSITRLVDMSAPATALQGVTVQGTGGVSPHFTGVFVHNGDGPFSEAAVVDNVIFRAIGDQGGAVIVGGRAIVSHSRFLHAGFGISVGGHATISDNVLTGPPGSDIPTNGISVFSAHVRVVRNDVSGFRSRGAGPLANFNNSAGILVIGPGSVGGLAAGTGNRIHDNALGVSVVCTQGATIANNMLHDNFVAGLLAINCSSHNQFLHNVFTGVSEPPTFDCLDESEAIFPAETSNTWLDNTGATRSLPPGICLP